MISYYTSKHPGFAIYITFIILSVPALLFAQQAPLFIGIMSILWGIYTLMRCLSLYEVSGTPNTQHQKRASKKDNGNSSALAYDLVSRMEHNNHLKHGKNAMKSMQERTLLWLILGIFYAATCLYREWAETQHLTLYTISNICTSIFIIGTAFWAGQTYAYSKTASRILMSVLGVLFIALLFYAPITLSPVNLETSNLINNVIQNSTTIPLALLLGYSAIVMLYACITKTKHIIGAFMSLCIIALLSLYTVQLHNDQATMALWLVGWSMISVFWIRAFIKRKTRYILYQCQ